MTIYSTDDEGNIIVIFDSRWRFPELLGYSPDDPRYKALQRLWEQATWKEIPRNTAMEGGETTVGYSMDIHSVGLKSSDDITEVLEDTYLDWRYVDGRVEPTDNFFNWDDSFIDDLKLLHSSGVRGTIVVRGEYDDYEKYVLDDQSVKKFTGVVVFAEEPDEEF